MKSIARLNLTDETQTAALAENLAGLAEDGDVLALEGQLGTGKSVFARAFISARNGALLEVPSPTFTLVQSYELPSGTIHHFDLYRLNNSEEVLELGLEDAFAAGISLIEWPGRASDFLPPEHIEVRLAYGEKQDQRTAELFAGQVWEQRWEAADFG